MNKIIVVDSDDSVRVPLRRTLEAEGYISKTRSRKYNEYSLTEKIAIKDSQGRPRALAHWKYRPARIQSTVEELKRMLRHKQTVGQDIYIEHLHIVQSQTNIGFQISPADLENLANSNPAIYQTLLSIRSSIQKRNSTEG